MFVLLDFVESFKQPDNIFLLMRVILIIYFTSLDYKYFERYNELREEIGTYDASTITCYCLAAETKGFKKDGKYLCCLTVHYLNK